MGNFSNYWDLTTLFTKIKNKLKSISDKIDDSVSLKTATGNSITLTDAAKANAEELSMTIEPVQSGSGDPSPTNVRPISGLTSGEVTRTGKNVFNLSTYPQTYTIAGVTHTINASEGTISFHRDSASGANHYYSSTESFKLKAGSYILSAVFPTGMPIVRLGINDATVVLTTTGEVAFTLTEDTNISLYLFYSSSLSEDVTISDIMIRSASFTDSTFEPYTANTATITFGQTVYGGSVNFKTGEVTVTHGMVDAGVLTWTYNTTYKYFDCELAPYGYSGKDFGAICSIYANLGPKNPGAMINAENGLYSWGTHINVKDTAYTDAATFKTAMSGVQLCYELATPTTLTLTPAELELLKGNNTITANGAEISIEYYPDNAIGALAGRVDEKPSTADVDTRVRQSIYELGMIESYNGNYYRRVFPTETGNADLTLFRSAGSSIPGIPEPWSPALAWRVNDTHAMIGVGYNTGRVFISGGSKFNSTGVSQPKWTKEILTNDALETKYLHYISIQRYNNDAATIDVTIPIINNTAATMTKTEILTYLDEHEQRIKPIHGMYHNIYQGNFVLPEPIVDFIYTYYEGSEDKRLIFYRFDNDEITVTSTNQYLRIEDRFVVQIVQNA